jgi:hypothetical protein
MGLSFRLLQGLPFALFPSSFPTKILYAHLMSPMNVTYSIHLHDHVALVFSAITEDF